MALRGSVSIAGHTTLVVVSSGKSPHSEEDSQPSVLHHAHSMPTDFTTAMHAGGAVSLDPLTTGLLLGGWVIAFLLGKELQAGYAHWRAKNSDRPRSG